MVDELLSQLGLNQKEAKLYQILLERKPETAAVISSESGESRTNTYMILESLQQKGLVAQDDSHTVRRYSVQSPQRLQELLLKRQEELKQANQALKTALPDLSSKYALAQHKPGVTHREGLQGLKDVLEDMVRSGEEILLIPSNIADEHKEAFILLQEATARRKESGIPTRALMHERGRLWPVMKVWPKQGVKTRFLGEDPYDGEVIMYGETCVFIEYSPDSIVTTTLINKTIATTMKQLFEQLWHVAIP